MNFIFVRHGVATGAEGRCIGHTDLVLSETGAAAIERVASNDALHNGPLSTASIIISSDLQRASQSAFIISKQFAVPFSVDVRLREMSFGDWDGATWADLELRDATRLSAWMQHWQTEAPPDGESVDQLAARVRTFLIELLANDASSESTIIVVAHAGSIRAALCLLHGVPLDKMFDIAVEHANPIAVSVTPELRERLT